MKHPSYFAKTQPDKTAYRMATSGDTLTYAELDRLSNQGAQALRSLGVGLGESIALLFENRLDFIALTWAAQRSGVFYTAISHHLTPAEIAYIMRDCGANVAIVSDSHAHMVDELQRSCPGVRFFVSGDCADPALDWQTLQASMPEAPVEDEAAGADLLYSSGTTGRPKGITREFERQPVDTVISPLTTLLFETMGMMNRDTVYLSPAPLYHAAPLRTSMFAVTLGGTSIIMEKFDAEQCLALIDRHRVTHAQFVPTMFVRMLKLSAMKRDAYDHSSLQVAFHAAAPCPQDIKTQMIEWWGPVLIEYYAGTEANGITLVTSEDWLRHPGTVGRSLVGDIVIVDSDGQELPPGEIGDVYFNSGVDFSYRNDPEKTKLAYLRPGCSTMGDVGYVDEEGFLFLTDRAAYMIISGGVNIYPQEIEDLLISHPDVADVAVFGIPNEEMGEEVKAVVQLESGVPETRGKSAELIDWCRNRLSKIKAPRSVDFIDDMPRTPTGKLMKRKLKERYWTRESSQR